MEQIPERKCDLTCTHNPRSKPPNPTHKPPTPNKLSNITTHARFPNSIFSRRRFLRMTALLSSLYRAVICTTSHYSVRLLPLYFIITIKFITTKKDALFRCKMSCVCVCVFGLVKVLLYRSSCLSGILWLRLQPDRSSLVRWTRAASLELSPSKSWTTGTTPRTTKDIACLLG
jgi:hypothetical protein